MKNLTALLLLPTMLLSACGGSSSAVNTGSTATTEYVGEIQDADYFVAIAIGPSDEVLAYICNGRNSDYLFHGVLQNDAVTLTSDAGDATLQATREGTGYGGSFFANGTSYSFNTTLAQDYGGLYRVKALSEFDAEGTSQGGATLKVHLTPDKTGFQVTVTTPNNNTLSFDRTWEKGNEHNVTTEYGGFWIIFLNDGRSHGGYIKNSFKVGLKQIDPIDVP